MSEKVKLWDKDVYLILHFLKPSFVNLRPNVTQLKFWGMADRSQTSTGLSIHVW